MSVTIFFRTDSRPYSGYDDPSLPIGSYIAQGGVAGNGSGGVVTITFRFMSAEEEPRISLLYNLEQLSIDTSSVVPQPVDMDTVNMDNLSLLRAASPQKWNVVTTAGPSGSSSVNLTTMTGLPLWLGSPNQGAPSGNGGLQFRFVNTDLLLYAITIQGYMWGPRSILAEGGPKRPINGLFR